MWRRPLAALLIVLSTPLVAAGQGAPASRVTLWHSYRGAEQDALEEVVARFNGEHSNIEVVVVAQPHDSYASKLTTAIPRDNGPDVFIFGHDRLGDWAEAGIISPVGAVDRAIYFAETLSPAEYRGELYGIPLAFKSTLLFYNRKLIASPPTTTNDMLERAETLSAQGITGLAYQYDDFYYHALWHFGFGGELWSDDGELMLDSPESLAAMEFVVDMQRRGILPAEPSGALVAQLFNDAKAAMVIHGPWFIGEIADSIDFGVAPLPEISGVGERARPFLTVELAYLSARPRDPAAAAEVLAYLAGASSAQIRAEVGRQAVAHKAPWRTTELASDAVLAAFREQLGRTRAMGNAPRDRTIWEPAQLTLRKVLRAGEAPAAAAQAGIRRHAAITRPAPPRRSPWLAIILGVGALGGAVLWLLRSAARGLRGSSRERLVRGWSWISPAALGTVVLLFVPFVVGLGLSLFSHRQGEWTYVGFANFADILGARTFDVFEPLSFYFALAVTVAWTLVNVLAHVAIGLALALLLARPALRLRPLYRVLLIVPWAVPNYITALIWKAMFSSQRGVINAVIERLGGDEVAWFSSFPTAFFANICANAWLGFPFMMVVCLGALQSIPANLYEAADVDGANAWQKFRHITVPLLRPALLPAVLIGTIWTFNQFNIVYLVSGGEPNNSTDILISEAYRWAFTRQEQYGYAAAYAALIFVILLGWSVFASKMGKRVEAAA